ncbi:hypothetical protein T08_1558 [Trichinella sp. T8]|nr:hypothetical protein T08_1558 [Trichinella sp. T8]
MQILLGSKVPQNTIIWLCKSYLLEKQLLYYLSIQFNIKKILRHYQKPFEVFDLFEISIEINDFVTSAVFVISFWKL